MINELNGPIFPDKLTYWLMQNMAAVINFQTFIKANYIENFLWNFPQVIDREPHWPIVIVGRGNGLVPLCNEQLHEQVLTNFYYTIWHG